MRNLDWHRNDMQIGGRRTAVVGTAAPAFKVSVRTAHIRRFILTPINPLT
jgi:hypothetical protein